MGVAFRNLEAAMRTDRRHLVTVLVILVGACGPSWTEELTGGGGGGGGGSGTEVCDNGLDDDRDGQPDDGCTCAVGSSQACWPGEPTQRNEGACHDGVQICQGDEEFRQWGPCEGANMPSTDIPADGIDMDCGGTDGPDSTTCEANEYGEGCFNGRDDDCDGLSDCEDPECSAKCGERCTDGSDVCENGIDNNCDAISDTFCDTVTCTDECGEGGPGDSCITDGQCADAYVCEDGVCTDDGGGGGPGTECFDDGDCAGALVCFDGVCGGQTGGCTDEVCMDGIDNDCDETTDCEDNSCGRATECGFGICDMPIAEDCNNGFDEDCDQKIDCEDTECATAYDCICNERCVASSMRYCDTPISCDWGIQRCNPDGTWGACLETDERPPGCETSGPDYNRDCCLLAPGTCCQDYPNNTSVGECSGVAYCTY